MSMNPHTYIPPGMSVIGTCSICGGPVAVETVSWSVTPPTPRCLNCGAVKAETYGPEIPMRPAPTVTATQNWK